MSFIRPGRAPIVVQVESGGGQPEAPTSGLTTFTVTSATAGQQPFTVGHVFKQGDIPSGQTLTGLQCSIKNAWPDGSAKFAILSGYATLTSNVARTVGCQIGTAPSGSNVATSALSAVTAAIAFGSDTVNFGSGDWDSPFQTLTSGPLMSSWNYRKPIGSDAHLVAWLEVRAYSNGLIEVMPWIENGYMTVASPSVKSGRATFTLNGSLKYDSINDANTAGGATLDPVINGSGVLSIAHHTRHVLIRNGTHCYRSDSTTVTPAHNRAYLQSAKVIPAYHASSINESSLSALTSHYHPGFLAYIEGGMGSTGYSPDIGLVPNTSALWIVSGDTRAYAALMAHGFSLGNYCIHYRDQSTNRPIVFASWPNSSMATDTSITAPDGINSCLYASSHHPAAAYLPYILTGWNWFLEEMQFQVTDHYLARNQSFRKNATNYFYGSAFGYGHNEQGGLRAQGWQWRTLAMCAAFTPDADSWRSQLITCLEYNATKFRTEYESGDADNAYGANVLGVGGYGWESSNITDADPDNGWSAWQDAFFTMAVALTYDLQLITSATPAANLLWLRDFKYKAYAGLLGRAGVSSEYCFTRASNYQKVKVGQDTGSAFSWRTTWGDVWTATWGSSNTDTNQDSLQLTGGNFPDGTSYWGNIQGAIAYGVEHGGAGMLDGYLRMVNASNWSSFTSTIAATPVSGIKPRTLAVPYSLPASGQAVAIETISGGDSGYQTVRPSEFTQSEFGRSVAGSFGSGVMATDYGSHGAYVIGGTGGHAHPDLVDAIAFDYSTATWARIDNSNGVPNRPPPGFVNGTNATGSPYYEATGTEVPAPPHPYSCPVYVPSANGGGTKGSLAYAHRGAVTSGADGSTTPHAMNLATGTWARMASAEGSFGGLGNAEVRAAFDPVTNRIYLVASNYHNYTSQPYFDVSSDTYGSAGSFSAPTDFGSDGCGSYPGLVFDPVRRLLLRTLQRKLRALDLNNLSAGWQLLTLTNSTTLPDEPLGNSELCYHAMRDAFYYLPGTGGSTLYKITPPASNPISSAWVVSSQTIGGATLHVHGNDGITGSGSGAYRSLHYVPSIQMLSWAAMGQHTSGSTVRPMTLINPT